MSGIETSRVPVISVRRRPRPLGPEGGQGSIEYLGVVGVVVLIVLVVVVAVAPVGATVAQKLTCAVESLGSIDGSAESADCAVADGEGDGPTSEKPCTDTVKIITVPVDDFPEGRTVIQVDCEWFPVPNSCAEGDGIVQAADGADILRDADELEALAECVKDGWGGPSDDIDDDDCNNTKPTSGDISTEPPLVQIGCRWLPVPENHCDEEWEAYKDAAPGSERAAATGALNKCMIEAYDSMEPDCYIEIKTELDESEVTMLFMKFTASAGMITEKLGDGRVRIHMLSGSGFGGGLEVNDILGLLSFGVSGVEGVTEDTTYEFVNMEDAQEWLDWNANQDYDMPVCWGEYNQYCDSDTTEESDKAEPDNHIVSDASMDTKKVEFCGELGGIGKAIDGAVTGGAGANADGCYEGDVIMEDREWDNGLYEVSYTSSNIGGLLVSGLLGGNNCVPEESGSDDESYTVDSDESGSSPDFSFDDHRLSLGDLTDGDWESMLDAWGLRDGLDDLDVEGDADEDDLQEALEETDVDWDEVVEAVDEGEDVPDIEISDDEWEEIIRAWGLDDFEVDDGEVTFDDYDELEGLADFWNLVEPEDKDDSCKNDSGIQGEGNGKGSASGWEWKGTVKTTVYFDRKGELVQMYITLDDQVLQTLYSWGVDPKLVLPAGFSITAGGGKSKQEGKSTVKEFIVDFEQNPELREKYDDLVDDLFPRDENNKLIKGDVEIHEKDRVDDDIYDELSQDGNVRDITYNDEKSTEWGEAGGSLFNVELSGVKWVSIDELRTLEESSLEVTDVNGDKATIEDAPRCKHEEFTPDEDYYTDGVQKAGAGADWDNTTYGSSGDDYPGIDFDGDIPDDREDKGDSLVDEYAAAFPDKNILVVHQDIRSEIDFKADTQGLEYLARVDDFYVIALDEGTVENSGDGGFINWRAKGNLEKTGDLMRFFERGTDPDAEDPADEDSFLDDI